ncbi:MAG TPA: chromate resistance protein ChrB domain-containing protein, partial [Planctomycetota bacterium]|nr:chromate resistance protein ChrB domain-containing protein [Planctomycetota bacterium]
MKRTDSNPWLVLVHRLPFKPAYLRVKVGRLLDRIGAVAVKNTVYVLPRTEENQEHYQWIVRTIAQEGGEATVFEARFVEGLKDTEVERLFRDARDRDYRTLIRQARTSQSLLGRGRPKGETQAKADSDITRLRRQFDEIAALDFFGAPGRQAADLLISGLERSARSRPDPAASLPKATYRIRDYLGRTWVTRKDIHVDRMACAWLIRRFIDPKAKFRFVLGKTHVPRKDEVRFDMFEGEFTHEGDKCTFEVLVDRFRLEDQAL